jgi:phosphate transport system substrate-binding protein
MNIQEFIVARDGLSIIVNHANTIESVSLDDLGKIYRGEITNWKNIGGSNEPIVLYGRQTTSGTYVFFRDTILKGDYDLRTKNMEGNQAIVDAVKNDKNGIGYVGIGYVVDETGLARKDIKIAKIATTLNELGISPLDTEEIKTGAYPLSRPLFQYLAELPQKGSLIEKFLLFEYSMKGFEVTAKTGFFPPIQEDTTQNEILFEAINKQ